MTYFRQVSDLLYQSQLSNRNSSSDYIRVKNLFRRVKIREDLYKYFTTFTKYKITGEQRPEQVAENYYGSPEFDWVVLISNNIINVRTEWPLSDSELEEFLFRKYTETELTEVHHYETTTIYDSRGKLIVPFGKEVDEDFTVSYFEPDGNIMITVNPVSAITNYEYETKKNDDKRNINLLETRFLQSVINDMKQIMSYGFSSQYVDNNTKKGENLTILSLR